MSLMGLLGRGFGAASPPDAPTLTWADNGDGTGAVATIAGAVAGSTNKVYTVPRTGGSWTLSSTRTGNGTIELELAVGAYLAYVLSEKDGAYRRRAGRYRQRLECDAAARWSWNPTRGRTDLLDLRGSDSCGVCASSRFAKKVFYLFARTAIAKIPLKPSKNGISTNTFD